MFPNYNIISLKTNNDPHHEKVFGRVKHAGLIVVVFPVNYNRSQTPNRLVQIIIVKRNNLNLNLLLTLFCVLRVHNCVCVFVCACVCVLSDRLESALLIKYCEDNLH